MKRLIFALLFLIQVGFSQELTIGVKLGESKEKLISLLDSKNIEYVESGMLVMVEILKIDELLFTADFEFDEDGNLIGIDALSDEVLSNKVEKDIPVWFRQINSKIQEEFGLPQNRENFDLASIPETELYVLREWKTELIKVELGILHQDDIYAIAIKMKAP